MYQRYGLAMNVVLLKTTPQELLLQSPHPVQMYLLPYALELVLVHLYPMIGRCVNRPFKTGWVQELLTSLQLRDLMSVLLHLHLTIVLLAPETLLLHARLLILLLDQRTLELLLLIPVLHRCLSVSLVQTTGGDLLQTIALGEHRHLLGTGPLVLQLPALQLPSIPILRIDLRLLCEVMHLPEISNPVEERCLQDGVISAL